jgi:ankyrin repeat protein
MNLTVFYNKYNVLQFLNEKFSSKSIDSAEAEKLISKIGDHLKDFGLNSELVFSTLTLKLKEKTVKLLNSVDKNLDLLKHTNAVDNLRKNISDFQSSLNTLEIQTEKKVAPTKIELKLAVFCDIGACCDWNGVVTKKMKEAFKDELPFITTRSLLQGCGLNSSSNSIFLEQFEMQKILIKNDSRWDIYQLCTPNNGNEFILFLPKSVLSDKTSEQKLSALDFNTDGLLKKVAAIDLFNEPADQNDPNAFLHIFCQKPKIRKIFYFHGHGNSNHVAGFPAGNYKNILHSLAGHKCKGLMINSCFSGGKSSLQALSTGVDPSFKYSMASSPLSYPIIVGSIGDFPTHQTSSRIKDLLDGFQNFIQSNPQSTEKARQIFKDPINSDKNFSKLYLPSPQGIPGVFKPICEEDKGYSLTHLEIKKSKVEPNEAKTGIKVKNKQFLYISPMVSDVPIVFKDIDPVLVSMIPGNGSHFLQSLQINSANANDFLKKTIDWHKKSELDSNKAFFIKTLEGHDFEEIVLFKESYGGFFACRQGDSYFYSDQNDINLIHPITAIQHALIVKFAATLASPSSDAIDTTAQGYENKELFRAVLHSEFFQKTNTSDLRDFIALLDSWNNFQATDAEVMKFAKERLSRAEIEDLTLFLLMLNPQLELAQRLIKEEKIGPNIKNAWGYTILYALNLRKFPAHRDLITQEIDCNLLTRGYSPLHIAASGDIELVKMMLKQPGVNINLKDFNGFSPIFYAVNNPEVFNLLREAGASLKEITKNGSTLLNKAILTKQWDLCEELLTIHKVDPNLGAPSALNLAIEQNADDLIAKLIKAGAKPFTRDSNGFIPFIQAILAGKVDIVKSLVQEKKCSLNTRDISGLSPLAAALWSENLEIIKALYEKKEDIDILPGSNDESTLLFLAQKLELKGRTDLLKELFKADFRLFDKFLEKMPDLVIKWIKSGVIDLHCPTATKTSIYSHIYSQIFSYYKRDKYKAILPFL